jgi:hypothetical protein
MTFSDDDAASDEIVLDGVIYRINVSEEFGRFFASLRCMTCARGHVCILYGDSYDEALAQIRAVLHEHHNRIHDVAGLAEYGDHGCH